MYFKWLMDVDTEPMVYEFAYKVEKDREDYKISLEQLTADTELSNGLSAYNYFRAHKPTIGNGRFSTALNEGY